MSTPAKVPGSSAPLTPRLRPRWHRTSQRRTNPAAVMPLMEHVRELRRRLAYCLLALIPGLVLGFWAFAPISRFITAPICDVRTLPMTQGQCGPLVITGSLLAPFTVQVKVALATAIIVAAPVWLYHLWAFLAPGLHRHERRTALAFVACALPLFAAGLALCYWMLPRGVALLVGLTPQNVTFFADYASYLSLVVRLGLVFGAAFVSPVVVVGLNLAGVLPASALRQGWRFWVLGVFVFAAVATPTGDPLTMMAVALPMLVLIVVAWGVCAAHDRQAQRRRAEQATNYEDKHLVRRT